MGTKESATKEASRQPQNADSGPEHDQDSDPPRTAIPAGTPKTAVQTPHADDPDHDQDSDPPRTAVPPKV